MFFSILGLWVSDKADESQSKEFFASPAGEKDSCAIRSNVGCLTPWKIELTSVESRVVGNA